MNRPTTIFPDANSTTQRIFSHKRTAPDFTLKTPPRQKLQRMVPVSQNPTSFSSKDYICKEELDPWQKYQKIFKIEQAGLAIFAHVKNSTFKEAVIKETKIKGKDVLDKIKPTSHKNLVHLHEALYYDDSIFFSYEVMDVSLSQVFCTPLGQLQPYEVAAFCVEVLIGIEYIHNTLKWGHGSLSAENILLKTNGEIKIGK
jgi:serine/threonine protein kinase